MHPDARGAVIAQLEGKPLSRFLRKNHTAPVPALPPTNCTTYEIREALPPRSLPLHQRRPIQEAQDTAAVAHLTSFPCQLSATLPTMNIFKKPTSENLDLQPIRHRHTSGRKWQGSRL